MAQKNYYEEDPLLGVKKQQTAANAAVAAASPADNGSSALPVPTGADGLIDPAQDLTAKIAQYKKSLEQGNVSTASAARSTASNYIPPVAEPASPAVPTLSDKINGYKQRYEATPTSTAAAQNPNSAGNRANQEAMEAAVDTTAPAYTVTDPQNLYKDLAAYQQNYETRKAVLARQAETARMDSARLEIARNSVNNALTAAQEAAKAYRNNPNEKTEALYLEYKKRYDTAVADYNKVARSAQQSFDFYNASVASTNQAGTELSDYLKQQELEYNLWQVNLALREKEIKEYDEWQKKNARTYDTVRGDIKDTESRITDLESKLSTSRKYNYEMEKWVIDHMEENSARRYNLESGLTRQTAEMEREGYEKELAAEREKLARLNKELGDYYSNFAKAPDFAEMSGYVPTADGKAAKYTPGVGYVTTGYKDLDYERINKNPDAVEKAHAQEYTNNSEGVSISYLGKDKRYLEYLHDDEIQTYNYLYAKNKNEADKYIEFLTPELRARENKTYLDAFKAYANETPFRAAAFTTFAAPLKAKEMLYNLDERISGNGIDENASYNRTTNALSATRETANERMADFVVNLSKRYAEELEKSRYTQGSKLAEKVSGYVNSESGEETIRKTAEFTLGTLESIADFLYTTAITGGFAPGVQGGELAGMVEQANLILMSMEAMPDALIEAKTRGLSDNQAISLGLIAGAAEYFSERISIEALFNESWDEGLFRYLFKNTISEGEEEIESDLINLVADALIAGDKSKFRQKMKEYQADGATEKKAFNAAFLDQLKEMGLDFLGGALSGFAMSGGALTLGGAVSSRTGQQYESFGALINGLGDKAVDTYIELAKATDNVEIKQMAADIEAKLEAHQAVTDEEMGRMALSAIDAARQSETQARPAETEQTTPAMETEQTQNAETTAAQAVELSNEERAAVQGIMEQYAEQGVTEEKARRMANASTELERTAILYDVAENDYNRVRRVSDALKTNVSYYNKAAANGFIENGYYDAGSNTLYVNAQSQNPVVQIVSHELTHQLEGSDGYGDFAEWLHEYLGADEWDSRTAEINSRYGESGVNYNAEHELVAEFVENDLIPNENAVYSLVNHNRTLAQRISDFLHRVKNKLARAGVNDTATLDRGIELFRKMLAENQTRTARQSNTATITHDESGNMRTLLPGGETVNAEPQTNVQTKSAEPDGKIKLPGGETQEEIRNENNASESREAESTEQLSGGNRGREAGGRAGGESRRVDSGRPQRRADFNRAALDRQSKARSTDTEKVSASGLGIKYGSDSNNLTVYPRENWDAELRSTAERIKNETRLDVQFVLGTPEIVKNGVVLKVREAVVNGQVIIQADHLRYKVDQLADRVIFKQMAEDNPRMLSMMEESVIESYGRENYDRMIADYSARLNGIVSFRDGMTDYEYESALNKVKLEVFADAHAGLNQYGAGNESSGRQYSMSTTNVDTNPDTHTAEQMKLINEYVQAVDESLKEFVDRYKNDPNASFARYTISDVSDRQARDVERILGGDYSEYTNAIDRNGVTHIIKRHGENGIADRSMANSHDIARIGYVLENYDSVERLTDKNGEHENSLGYRMKNNDPSPMIKYSKKINGTYYVVEAVPDTFYKKMWVVSAYMDKKSGGYMRAIDAAEATPSFTPEASHTSPTSRTVSQTETNVKTQSSIGGTNARNANLDALRSAKEMQRNGADMADIFKKTGWYVGMDGKWRFEIDDSNMRYYNGGDAEFRRNHPEYRRLQELYDKSFYSTLTEAESRELKELDDTWGREKGRLSKRLESGNARLRDIIDHPVLFEAYPELAETGIKFGELEDGALGSYNSARNVIELSDQLRNDAPESTIIHEIQHAIQQAEDFTKGASTSYWASRGEYTPGTAYENAFKKLTREQQNQWARYKDLDFAMEQLMDKPGEEAQYEHYEKLSDEIYSKLWGEEWFRNMFDADRLRTNEGSYYRNLYNNTAGEIEARDVERRRTWDSDRRRNTLPNLGDENTVFADGTVSFNENISFRQQVYDVINNKNSAITTHLNMGVTPEIYGEFGFKTDIPVLITANHVRSMNADVSQNGENAHGLSKSKIADIPRALSEPVMVMVSNSNPNALVVVTDIIDKEHRPVVVALKPDGKGNYLNAEIDANIALSGYGKDAFDKFIIKAFSDGRMLKCDYEKSHQLQQTPGVQFPNNLPNGDFAANISQFVERVKKNRGEKLKNSNGDTTQHSVSRADTLPDTDTRNEIRRVTNEFESGYMKRSFGGSSEKYDLFRDVKEGIRWLLKAETKTEVNAAWTKYRRALNAFEAGIESDDMLDIYNAYIGDAVSDAYEPLTMTPELRRARRAETIRHRMEAFAEDNGIGSGSTTFSELQNIVENLGNAQSKPEQKLAWAEYHKALKAWVEETQNTRLAMQYNDIVGNMIEREFSEKSKAPEQKANPYFAKKDLKRDLINMFNVKSGERARLGGLIETYANRLIEQGRLDYQDRSDLFNALYESGTMLKVAESMYREGRETVVGKKIYVPAEVKAEFGDDWNSFRSRAFANGVLLTNSGSDISIDQYNQELAGCFPGLFDENDYDRQGMLEKIVQLAEEGKDEQLTMAEYVAQMAREERVSMDEILADLESKVDAKLEQFAAKASLESYFRGREAKANAEKSAQTRDALNRLREGQLERDRKERLRRREMAERQRAERDLRILQKSTLKQLQWLAKNEKKAPAEFKQRFRDVLGDLDVLAVNAVPVNGKYYGTWADLADRYKEAKANDPNFLPNKHLDDIVARLTKDKIGDLELYDLQNLYRAAVAVRTEYYNRNNVIAAEKASLFSDVYEGMKEDMNAAKKGIEDGLRGKVNEFKDDMNLSALNYLRHMVGWKEDSGFHEMAKQLERGERDYNAYKTGAAMMLRDFYDQNQEWVKNCDGQGKNGIWYEYEVPRLLVHNNGDAPLFGDTVKIYMTPAQKVHLYLESKNEQNLLHMAGYRNENGTSQGGGRTFADKELYQKGKKQDAYNRGTIVRLAPETVKNMVSDLTPQEKQLADILERYYNVESKAEINRVSNILYGFDRAVVNNYAPIQTNDSFNATQIGTYDINVEHAGSLKERLNGSVTPTLNVSALDAFERSVDTTAKFVAYAIPMRNWETLLKWRDVDGTTSTKDVIRKNWGEKGYKYIEDLLNELQSGKPKTDKAGWEFFENIFGKYIQATFAGNPSIMLKQYGSYYMAMPYLGIENMPLVPRKIDADIIDTYTKMLEYRGMGYSTPETSRYAAKAEWSQKNKAVGLLFGGDQITLMDKYTAKLLWPWAENKVRKEFPHLDVGTKEQIAAGESQFYRKVAEVYENAVFKSQSTSDIMHQSKMRRSNNPVARTITIFKSDSAQGYNAIREAQGELQYLKRTNADKQAIKKARGKVVEAWAGFAASAAWGALIDFLMNLWKWKGKAYKDDDGEMTVESFFEQFGTDIGESFLGMFPGADTAAEIFDYIIAGDYWDGLDIMGYEQLEDIIKNFKTTYKKGLGGVEGLLNVTQHGGDAIEYLRTNGQPIYKAIKQAAQDISTYFFGFPTANIEKYIIGTIRWVSPETGRMYDALWTKSTKANLKKLNGEDLEAGVSRYIGFTISSVDNFTARMIKRLYLDGYSNVLPPEYKLKREENGEETELDAFNRQIFEQVWERAVAEGFEKLYDSRDFFEASDEEQAKYIANVYEAAKSEGYRAVYGVEYAIENIDKKHLEKARELNEQGVSYDEYFEVLMAARGIGRLTDYEKLSLNLNAIVDIAQTDENAALLTEMFCDSKNVSGGLAYALENGISAKEFAKAYSDAVLSINKGSDNKAKKALEMLRYADENGYSEKLTMALGKAIGGEKTPEASTLYTKLRALGRSVEESYEWTEELLGEDKAAKQFEKLGTMNLKPGEVKDIVDALYDGKKENANGSYTAYGLLLGLLDSGFKPGDALDIMRDWSTQNYNGAKERMQYLENADMSEDNIKAAVGVIWQGKTEDKSGKKTDYGKFLDAMESGLSAEDALRLYNSTGKIGDISSYTKTGLNSETAVMLASALEDYENPTKGEKYRAAYNVSDDPVEKVRAIDAVAKSGNVGKAAVVVAMGLDVEDYVKAFEALKDYDGNYGKGQPNDEFNSDEAKALIDAMFPDYSRRDKAILWQMIAEVTTSKKNPYDKAAGENALNNLKNYAYQELITMLPK